MKKILQYIVVFLTAIFLFSCSDGLSDFQKKSFIKFYGSYQLDVGHDVQQLASGGYALTGTMMPPPGDGNPVSIPKMFLILTDEYGNQLENSPLTYGGDHGTEGHCLLALDDGYLIVGQITDSLVITVGAISNTVPHTDVYIVRTDLSGNVIWDNQFGGNGNETAYHAAVRTGGGFVVAGKTEISEQEDLWIIMMDEELHKLSEMVGNNVTDDDEARYIHNTGNGYLVACTYNDAAYTARDFMVLNIDEDCNLIDARSMGTNFEDHARSIIPYKGKYLLMGYNENTVTGNDQIALHTFSLEANLIKNQELLATISASGTDFIGEACVISSNDSIAVIGSHEFNENKDILLQFVGDDGTIGTKTLFGQLGDQSGYDIKRTLDGGLILIGSNGLEGNSVISLVKTNAGGKF